MVVSSFTWLNINFLTVYVTTVNLPILNQKIITNNYSCQDCCWRFLKMIFLIVHESNVSSVSMLTRQCVVTCFIIVL